MKGIVKRLRSCAFDKDNMPNMMQERKLSVGDALEAAATIELLQNALREVRHHADDGAGFMVNVREALRLTEEELTPPEDKT